MSILKSSKSTNQPKKRVRFNLDPDATDNDEFKEEQKKLSALQIAHRRNVLGTKDMFLLDYGLPLQLHSDISSLTTKLKILDDFHEVEDKVNHEILLNKSNKASKHKLSPPRKHALDDDSALQPAKKKQKLSNDDMQAITSNNIHSEHSTQIIESVIDNHISAASHTSTPSASASTAIVAYNPTTSSSAVATKLSSKRHRQHIVKPEWKRPWKLYKVISGHLGAVGAVAMDPSNEYFATGSADRTIKLWDFPSGILKLTLTGHISDVCGLAISKQYTYMFSCSKDKQVRCWDLTTNRVIRHYHGHLSGVYCLSLNDELQLLFTGGRDSCCRVWDIRTKTQVMVLSGHKHTVYTCMTQQYQPHVVTGSADQTVRTYDLRSGGKTLCVLTNHKKGIRSLVAHPTERTFMSGAADNIKIWDCPNTQFLRNMNEKPMSIIDTLAINQDGVLISGHASGHLKFWDYQSGYKFDEKRVDPQPGSLDSEAGIMAATFDTTGSRLITCESDKTIKMWKQDMNATEETHPIQYNPPQRQRY
eukprot:CAMPEP_0197050040 /NCGR_PEP_ID=MMETSP1384-20130603/25030_1 /TAXON_ID=29189 /ORGANISM="Ammonia sp." /LENGTH=531 /DNA_ID=CAMNT_0042482399 /DNA_START=59 /DNA_END=1654 /DNA_ORIENTATION=+